MAELFGTPTTTTSGLQTSLDKYFDALLVSTLDPMTRFYQFGSKRPLPKNSGDVVVWNRGLRMGVAYTLSEGNPLSAVKQISTTDVSATIEQYGDVVNISDLIEITGVVNARKLATERLAVQAAESLDTIIKMAILGFPGGAIGSAGVTHYVKGSTSAFFSLSTTVIETASDPRLQVSDIRAVAFKLRSLNVPTFDGVNYVGIIHPFAVEDVISDSKWENFHQYTTPENIYRGEIGRLHRVRFVESTLAPVSRGSSNGIALSIAGVSTLAYGTVIFGKEFYGVTEIDGGVKTYLVEGASKADPLNQATVLGWKADFTSRVLNPSCGIVAWAGSGDTMTGASSTSARRTAGLNIGDYPVAW